MELQLSCHQECLHTLAECLGQVLAPPLLAQLHADVRYGRRPVMARVLKGPCQCVGDPH